MNLGAQFVYVILCSCRKKPLVHFAIHMAEQKAPTKKLLSLSQFKNFIFTSEALAIYTFSYLSFRDAISLIQSQRKLNLLKNPIESNVTSPSPQLHLAWYALLETHWRAFIENNALYRLKKIYDWSNVVAGAVYAKLRAKNAEFEEKGDFKASRSVLPYYFLPENLAPGEEELIYLYALIPIYDTKYFIQEIDLTGPAVSAVAPNLPLYQIVFPTPTEGFIVRTQDEETDVNDRNVIAATIFQYMQEGNRLNNMHVSLTCDLTNESERTRLETNIVIPWNSVFAQVVRARKGDDKKLSNKFIIVPQKFDDLLWRFRMILKTSMPRE